MVFLISTTFWKLRTDELELENENLRNQVHNYKENQIKLQSDLTECENEVIVCVNNMTHCFSRLGYYEYMLDGLSNELPSFLVVARDIAYSHEWVANEYDCTEFSRDTKHELSKLGWDTELVTGYLYNIGGETCDNYNKEMFDCRHSWVCLKEVCLETTGGTVIEPFIYGEEYKPK